MKIFVYGTLRKGLQRERKLSRSEFLGYGVVKGELYDLGRFPALLEGDGEVFGELYEIDEKTLFILDQVESYYPENYKESLYLRKNIQVFLNKSTETITSETYIYNRSLKGRNTKKIVNGDYKDYLDKQGSVYVF